MQLQPDVVSQRPPDQSAGDSLSRFSNVVAFLEVNVTFVLNELVVLVYPCNYLLNILLL